MTRNHHAEMVAALLDVPNYVENDAWRRKHAAVLKAIGAWDAKSDEPVMIAASLSTLRAMGYNV